MVIINYNNKDREEYGKFIDKSEIANRLLDLFVGTADRRFFGANDGRPLCGNFHFLRLTS